MRPPVDVGDPAVTGQVFVRGPWAGRRLGLVVRRRLAEGSSTVVAEMALDPDPVGGNRYPFRIEMLEPGGPYRTATVDGVETADLFVAARAQLESGGAVETIVPVRPTPELVERHPASEAATEEIGSAAKAVGYLLMLCGLAGALGGTGAALGFGISSLLGSSVGSDDRGLQRTLSLMALAFTVPFTFHWARVFVGRLRRGLGRRRNPLRTAAAVVTRIFGFCFVFALAFVFAALLYFVWMFLGPLIAPLIGVPLMAWAGHKTGVASTRGARTAIDLGVESWVARVELTHGQSTLAGISLLPEITAGLRRMVVELRASEYVPGKGDDDGYDRPLFRRRLALHPGGPCELGVEVTAATALTVPTDVPATGGRVHWAALFELALADGRTWTNEHILEVKD